MKKLASLALSVLFIGSMFSAYAATDADTTPPGDVEELTVTPYDSAVKLSWDAVTDDTRVAGYVISYGTESVDGETVTEYQNSEDVGNVKSFVLTELTNDTKYYFSIYAYDAAGNESEFWAPEVDATPSTDAGEYVDEDAPQVAKAEALDQEHVKVVFSEGVVLPTENPEDEFTIENDDTLEPLDVLSVEMDATDTKGRTVLLTTDKQEATVLYNLVANTGVKDTADNIIISGNSDTAMFEGSDKPFNFVSLKVESVEVTDKTHLLVEFNLGVVLGVDPTANFEIAQKDDDTKTLEITKVTLGTSSADVENASVLLETSEMSEAAYTLTLAGIEDVDGNELAADEASQEFEYSAGVGPEDVANFLAKQFVKAEKYGVTLTWKVPDTDAVESQELYMSKDKGGTYDTVDSLEPDVAKYDVENLDLGEYWFKLTQKDADENETDGSVVKIVLTETGPELLGLVLVSLGLGRVFGKKKTRK
ncbi:MAG: fibronectin type III domain-containing protein [Candidatus Gracilibacteria bacterium]|jgi:hypothetical protein